MSKVYDLVMGVFREPGLIPDLRERALPDDVSQVIRLAAGESSAMDQAVASTGETAEVLAEAGVFFLQQLLFAPNADSYRVLGAAADASQDRLRENYRWLMKWLHPDHNQDGWEAVYADRVNMAWQDLKTPARRAEYDQRQPSSGALVPMSVSAARRVVPLAADGAGPLLSGSMVRRLPALVLGALGLSALALVGLTYWAQTQTERELAERRLDRGPPPQPSSMPVDPALSGADTGAAPEVDAEQVGGVDAAPAVVADAVSEEGPAEPVTAATVAGGTAEAGLSLPVAALIALAPPPVPVRLVMAPEQPAGAIAAEEPDVAAAAARDPVEPIVAAAPAAAVRPSAPAPGALRERPASAASDLHASAVEVSATETVKAALPGAATAHTVPVASTTAAAAASDGAQPAPGASVAATTAAATPAAPAAPVAAEPAEPAPILVAAPEPVVTPTDADALVREFAAAYAAGDLARFDRLFSSDGRAAEISAMRSRFISTEMRYLEIEQLRWESEDRSARARAAFRDTYVPRGGRRAVTESGVMEWVIRVQAGDARIASVDRDATAP